MAVSSTSPALLGNAELLILTIADGIDVLADLRALLLEIRIARHDAVEVRRLANEALDRTSEGLDILRLDAEEGAEDA